MKAVGYIRVSTEEQVREGVSLEAQEDKIKKYADLHNLELIGVIRDEGKSGKDLNREGMQKVITLCKDRSVDHLVVYKMDRLTRRTLDLLTLVEEVFKPNGVQFHSISEKVDTSTAQGKFFLTITGAMAQMERDLISERTKEALQYKISKGELVGSPPLGFEAIEKELRKTQDELIVVQEIFKMKKGRGKNKLSLRQIANRLNEEMIPTKRGGKWYAGTVRYILRNSRYRELKEAVSV
ncbi:hypothetical protein ES702_04191 [subsurface metagenome]